MKKHLYIFIFAFALLSSLFIWRKPLTDFAIKSSVKYVTENLLGEKISFHDFERDNQRVTLFEPKIGFKSRLSEKGGIYLTADKILIDYQINWFKRQLKVHLSFLSPEVQIVKNKNFAPSLAQFFSPAKGPLKVEASFDFQDGNIELVDRMSAQDPVSQSFSFEAESRSIQSDHNVLSFGLSQKESHCKALISFREDLIHYNFDIKKVSVSELQDMVYFWTSAHSKNQRSFNFSQGTLDGNIDVTTYRDFTPVLQTQLVATNLRLYDRQTLLSVHIPKTDINLHTVKTLYNNQEWKIKEIAELWADSCTGSIKIPFGAQVNYQKSNCEILKSTNMKGEITFSHKLPMKVQLQGDVSSGSRTSLLTIEGSGLFKILKGDLLIRMKNHFKDKAQIRCSIEPFRENEHKFYAQLIHLSEEEADFIQQVLAPFYPEIKNTQIEKGDLSLTLNCLLKNLKPHHLNIEEFQLLGGTVSRSCKLQLFQGVCAAGQLQTDLSKPKITDGLHGSISLKANKAMLKEFSLADIEANAKFESGKLDFLQAQAVCSEIQTQVDFQAKRDTDPLKMSLKGKGQSYLGLMPANLQVYYGALFNEESVSLDLHGETLGHSFSIKGKGNIGQHKPVFFGFNVDKKQGAEKKNDQFLQFWQQFMRPVKVMPSLSYIERKLNFNNEAQFCLQNGWFHFDNVPVDKFISPFVFADTSLKLIGTANIHGEFDQQGLSLSYDNYSICLSHPTFKIVSSKIDKNKKGKHYFNFSKNTHFGSIELEEAEFFIADTPLQFGKIKGIVEITPDSVYAPKISSKVGDLNLNADFKLNYCAQGNLDLKLLLNQFDGPVSQLIQMLHSMGYSQAERLKVAGDLSVEPNQKSFFKLQRIADQITTNISLAGSLSKASFPFITQQPLKDISCQFFYDSENQSIEINNFEGLWRSYRKQDYSICSKHLKINLFSEEPSLFDFQVTNAYKDCARLMGKLYLNFGQKQPNLKIILDQNRNHIGNIALSKVYLALTPKLKLDYLNVNFSSNLASLQHDISLLQNVSTKVPSASVAAAKNFPMEGDVSGQWVFDLSKEKHQFFIWGDQVKIGETNSGFFQLKGHQQKNQIVVSELTYQDFKGSFLIEERPFCYFIRNFKFLSDQNLDLRLSGIYCKIFNSFQVDIEKLCCDLNRLKKLQMFSRSPYLYHSQGALDLKGKLEGGFFKGAFCYGVDFKGSTNNLKIEQLELKDQEIKGRIDGDTHHVKVVQLKSQLQKIAQWPVDLTIDVQDLIFHFKKGLCVEKLHFCAPASDLKAVEGFIAQKWRVSIPEAASKIVNSGSVSGYVVYNPEKSDYNFQLYLDPREYSYRKKNYFLEKVKLQYGPAGLKVALTFPVEDVHYGLVFKKRKFDVNAFQISLFDRAPQACQEPLKIQCSSLDGGILIDNITGALSGLRFDFVHRPERDNQTSFTLMGQMQIDGNELTHALPQSWRGKMAKLQIGKGYFLTGQLTLQKNDLSDFLFEGLFGAQDFQLFGFDYKSLSSTLKFSKSMLCVKDLKISDLSGELTVSKIDVNNQQFIIPEIELKDFKPSLLHRSNDGPVKHKPLIVNKLKVSNFKGRLSDPSSYRGDGFLTFQKSPKKQTSLLDIPAHLISKLGLDLSMLNPVEGKVMFILKDQKVIITKLVDVYSNERRCHFTLAKHPELSFIDFNGNLNVKIKMKQYVLLKFTEPYIISVNGPFSSPHYSFMRKKVVVDVYENSNL